MVLVEDIENLFDLEDVGLVESGLLVGPGIEFWFGDLLLRLLGGFAH
jgi:hypothetical protein